MLIRAEDKEKIKLLEDLRGKVVGTQKGSIQEDMARNMISGATFFLDEDIPALIDDLRQETSGRRHPGKTGGRRLCFKNKDLLNLECDSDRPPLGSAVAVKKGDADLLDRVNQILERLITENKITEFVQDAKVLRRQDLSLFHPEPDRRRALVPRPPPGIPIEVRKFMISLQNIGLTYNDKKIFSGISWLITERSRIGLVGDNGAGKTTLFRAIKGETALDSGAIEMPRSKRIGYLPQDLVELEPLPVMDYLKKQTGQEELEQQHPRHARTRSSPATTARTASDAMLNKFDAASEAFLLQDGYGFEARARRILKGLGFAAGDYAKNCRDFSGGWKMRIFLAVILLSDPDIMLLDEPTNHLDTESMEWLENYLRNYGGTLLTISHDHMFLDKMVNQIAELEHGARSRSTRAIIPII